MSDVSLDDWVGKSQTVVDALDVGHAACLAATLGESAPGHGKPLPALWHWCFFRKSSAWMRLALTAMPPAAVFCRQPRVVTGCGRGTCDLRGFVACGH